MTEVYPVILMADEDGYTVRIPDFRTATEGKI